MIPVQNYAHFETQVNETPPIPPTFPGNRMLSPGSWSFPQFRFRHRKTRSPTLPVSFPGPEHPAAPTQSAVDEPLRVTGRCIACLNAIQFNNDCRGCICLSCFFPHIFGEDTCQDKFGFSSTFVIRVCSFHPSQGFYSKQLAVKSTLH